MRAKAESIYVSSRRSFSSYRAGRAGRPPAAPSGLQTMTAAVDLLFETEDGGEESVTSGAKEPESKT